MKKLNAFILAFIMLLSVFPGTVSAAAENESLITNTPEFSAEGDGEIYTWYQSNLPEGRYLISFDYETATKNNVWIRLHEEQIYYAQQNYPLILMGAENISLCRDYGKNPITDVDLKKSYNAGQKYNFKIWVDSENKEIAVYIDDTLFAAIPMPERFKMNGFSIYSYGTDVKEGNSVYGNISFERENNANSNGFAPIYIKAEAPEGIFGNNFFSDNPVRFTLKTKNRLNTPVSGTVKYRISVDETGEVKWTSEDVDISYSEGEQKTFEAVPDFTYYGRLNLDIITTIDGTEYVKTVPYTMSNRTADMPVNKKVGVANQIAKGRSDAKISIPLQAKAGIGGLRDEMILWQDVETVAGEHNFTTEMDERLDLVEKYNLLYLHQWANGNGNVYPDPDAPTWYWGFPTTEDGLLGLKNFMTELITFADGRIDGVEVWNEINNLDGPYDGQYDKVYGFSAKFHKALYEGVKAADENVFVSGIDTDNHGIEPESSVSNLWQYSGSGEMDATLAKFQAQEGEEFDAISIHPYAGKEPEKSSSYLNMSPQWTRESLKKYGYDYNTPLYFSESGISEASVNYDRGLHASIVVRNAAYTHANDLGECIFSYVFHDISEYKASSENKTEGYFGITEASDTFGTEIPYLGKESYVALSYYNNLAAEAKSFTTNVALNKDNVYAYDIKDRDDNNIIMLGCINENETKNNITLSGIEKESVIVSDMFGNEERVLVEDGTLTIPTIQNEPTYIIFEETKTEKIPDDENPDNLYALIEGVTENPTEDVTITIYNEGYSDENVTPDNVNDAMLYYNQIKSGRNGEFLFMIKLDEVTAKSVKTAYVTYGEESKKYKILVRNSTVVAYEEQEEKVPSAIVTYIGTEPGVDIFYAKYVDGRLNMVSKIAEEDEKRNNMSVIELKGTDDGALEKVFVWEKETMAPLVNDLDLK